MARNSNVNQSIFQTQNFFDSSQSLRPNHNYLRSDKQQDTCRSSSSIKKVTKETRIWLIYFIWQIFGVIHVFFLILCGFDILLVKRNLGCWLHWFFFPKLNKFYWFCMVGYLINPIFLCYFEYKSSEIMIHILDKYQSKFTQFWNKMSKHGIFRNHFDISTSTNLKIIDTS